MKNQILKLLNIIFIVTFAITSCTLNQNNMKNASNNLNWLNKVEDLLRGVESKFNTKRLPNKLVGPATTEELKTVELELGQEIPNQLREFFLNESKYVYANWHIPDEFEMPKQIEHIHGGGIEMGLEILIEMNKSYKETLSKYYSDLNDSYNESLHNKFVFHTTWSGDFYAIDLNESSVGEILYLSWNEAPGHNYKLANSFKQFIEKWTELGFVGPEGGDLLYFLDDKYSGLNTNSGNAIELKKLFGK